MKLNKIKTLESDYFNYSIVYCISLISSCRNDVYNNRIVSVNAEIKQLNIDEEKMLNSQLKIKNFIKNF